MTDEIILFGSGLDQPIESSDEWVLDKIRDAVSKAEKEQNVDIAIGACRQLVKIAKTSGRGLAEGLYLIWKNWDAFGIKDDDPISYIYTRVGLHRATVDRYIKIAHMLNNSKQYGMPDELVEEIGQRNIKELVPISAALAQGYEINEKQWNKLANASDFNDVSRIIREEIKGIGSRSNILIISMDDKGILSAYDYKGNRAHVGYLEIDVDNEMAKKAIERIVTNSGILKT